MLRIALLLLAVLSLAPAPGLAQSDETHESARAQSQERHAPPRRLERPHPQLGPLDAGFKPSLAAQMRLASLKLSLDELALNERKRFLPGSLQLVMAAGFGTAAAFVHAPGLRAAFSLASAVSATRAIVQLSLHAGTKSVIRDFAAIDVHDQPSLWRKLRVGELGLAHAARVGRRRRIIDGCIGVLGAAAYVPVQFFVARRQDPGHRFGDDSGDYVGLSLSVIGLASSLVQALMESPAEQHYEQYRVLRRASAQFPR